MVMIAGVIDFGGIAADYNEMRETNGGKCVLESQRACLMPSAQGGAHTIRVGEGETTAVCDGRLYNADELRETLSEKGYVFQTDTDAEVFLFSYMAWGEQCAARFLGAFALAVWDSRRGGLFLARDCMGVKPLFYYQHGRMLIFASQIKTVLKHPAVKAEIDETAVAELILLGPGRTPGCGVFKGVRELKPAHGGFFSENGFAASAYWRLEAKAHTESFEETLAHVKNLVLDAIRRQSGAPVCSMLSGGLDSSVIAAVSGVKETFSVDYEENELFFKATAFQPDSDKKYIDAMTAFLGGKHTNIVLGTDDLVESLFLAVHARDLPGMADVDGSMLLFCRAIRADYAAALSGECADELFGGYPWYRDEKIRETDGFPWSQSTAYRASFLKDGALGAIDPVKYVYEKYSETVRGSAVLPGESALEKRMKEMYQLNLHWFMQTLIDRGDRMSGVSGLEIRMPFCDRRIAEYAYNIPWAFKNYKGREKGLLREAMKGMLPEEVLWRKKSPYPKTHHPKYLKKVSEILSDILSTPTAPLHQLIKKEALAALLPAENAAPGTQPWYGQLMTAPQTIAYFIQLNEWLSHYKVSVI